VSNNVHNCFFSDAFICLCLANLHLACFCGISLRKPLSTFHKYTQLVWLTKHFASEKFGNVSAKYYQKLSYKL